MAKWPRRNDPDRAEKIAAYFRDYRAKNREGFKPYNRERHLRKYGMTTIEFDAMWADQDWCCYICGFAIEDRAKTRIDHDHTTGVVRGILCIRCNNAMGVVDTYFDKIIPYRDRDALEELYRMIKEQP